MKKNELTALLTNKKNMITLVILLFVASSQYVVTIKNKWPYTSDSLFYIHNFYQIQGSSYEEARQRVLTNYPIPWKDKVQQNIFNDPQTYKKVYRVFTKRPLYPSIAFVLNYLVRSEYLAFILPIFFGYLGVIFINFHFVKIRLGYLSAVISSLLLIAFSPFLAWSTYIMTDTIGAFFWLLQIYFIFLYFTKNKLLYLKLFTASLIISLFNREQSILLILFLIIISVMIRTKVLPGSISNNNNKLLISTVIVSTLFMLGIKLFNQLTAWDNLIYFQSNYYLNSTNFTFTETFLFYTRQVMFAHYEAIQSIVRNPFYLLTFSLGLLGMCRISRDAKRTSAPLVIIDALLVASAFSSYLTIFIVPVFRYRFFFPLVISLIYFAIKFATSYFTVNLKANKASHIKQT